MTFLDDFMMRALFAAVGTALACGALGCFVVWRQMADFADTTAHAAISGVALALVFSISIPLGVLLVALAMAVIISNLSGTTITPDSMLGVLSHSPLAMGLVAVSLMPSARFDLESYLFGDILLVSRMDLLVIWGGPAALFCVAAVVRQLRD